MQFSWRVLTLCLLFGAAFGASIRVVSPSSGSTDIGVWSDYYYVYADTQPDHTFTLSMTPTGDNLQVSATSFTFSPSTWSFSFRVKNDDFNAAILGGFGATWNAFTDTDPQGFTAPTAALGFSFNLRWTQIDPFPSTTYLDQPSDPIRIWIQTPSTGSLTFTPTITYITGLEDITVTLTPNSITIPAGQLSASFTFMNSGHAGANNNAGVVGAVLNIQWDITGNEADKYSDPAGGTTNFNIKKRLVKVPTFSPSSYLGSYSSTLFFRVDVPVNDSITVTPQAADSTFSPSSVTLRGTDGMVAGFNWRTTSNSIDTSSAKTVNFQVSGNSGIYTMDKVSIPVIAPLRTFTVNMPSIFVLSNLTYISITIPAPAYGSVTVTVSSSFNLGFNQTMVTFSGNTTAAVIGVTPSIVGYDSISFLITGDDAAFYSTIDPVDVTVVKGGPVNTPAVWFGSNIPLYVAQESEKIPIRLAFSPTHSVTVTFSAPDLKFNPPSVTFRNGSEQQYFTITPYYSTGSITVTALFSGPDAPWFLNPSDINPNPTFSVNVQRRSIQAAWSAHQPVFHGSATRHLGKPYKIWITTPYVGKGELMSITPTSPYWTFSPKVLNFNNEKTRFEITATPTGITSGTIDWVIGGKDGGLWNAPGGFSFNTQIRPLLLGSAVLSPDERQKGLRFDKLDDKYYRLYDDSSYLLVDSDITSWHVWSFEMRSQVLPDKELTITPKCAHATFSPSSITVSHKARGIVTWGQTNIHNWNFNVTELYLSANFTVHPQAAGYHHVWFELSGGDADYYQRPTSINIYQNLVMRPDSEPDKANSSPFLQPVFAFTALLSFICYLIM